MIYKILHIIFIFVTFLFAGCSDEFASSKATLSTTKTTPPMTADGKLDLTKIERISITKFNENERKNSLVAKEKYIGKWAITEGYVEAIDQDFGSGYCIELSDRIYGYGVESISCHFPPSYKEKLMNLKKGDYLVVCGVFDKYMRFTRCFAKKMR